jgi:hypothetical protein
MDTYDVYWDKIRCVRNDSPTEQANDGENKLSQSNVEN